MESIQISSFYRSVSEWPETEMEISSFLKNFSKLLPAPFVAIYAESKLSAQPSTELKEESLASPGGSLGFGLKIRPGFQFNDPELRLSARPASPLLSEVPDLQKIVDEFLRKQLFQSEPLKSVHSSGSAVKRFQISGDFLNGFHLGTIPLARFGWLIVGFEKPFTSRDEATLIVGAQRLLELGKLHLLNSEIRLRGQFLSIASHELKTPLTSIYGMLQLQERTYRLKKDDPSLRDPERQQAYLKKMIRQVERLNEFIDGLLDISRIQNGRFLVEPTECDVARILREAITTRMQDIASEAGVRLHIESPEVLNAWVDSVRIEELVNNLIMNAIRFSPEGGLVWVRLRQDQESFRLSVRDQGPSVPLEDRERIFQPFERAQRTARLGGLGLGLFISRQIAQLHSGNVGLIESVPGKGNVFEANFPVRNASTAFA